MEARFQTAAAGIPMTLPPSGTSSRSEEAAETETRFQAAVIDGRPEEKEVEKLPRPRTATKDGGRSEEDDDDDDEEAKGSAKQRKVEGHK